LKKDLPFKNETEKNFLNKIHPLVRFIIPFVLVIPTLFFNNLTIIISIIIIAIVFAITSGDFIKIISKFKVIIPFVLFITLFIPIYYGTTVIFRIEIGFTLSVYQEGLNFAILLFLRIVGAAFTFLTYFSTLTYSEFIETLTKIRIIPSFLLGSIIIMLHYIPILATYNRKVLDAQNLRGKNFTSYWANLKTHAFIMGKNLIHNMDRSEKLYESLKMRGFTGNITFTTKKFRVLDYVTIFLSIILMIFIIYYLEVLVY